MAGDVGNIKVCSPFKLRSGLTGNYHAICHYSYNLPLAPIVEKKGTKNFYNELKMKGFLLNFGNESEFLLSFIISGNSFSRWAAEIKSEYRCEKMR